MTLRLPLQKGWNTLTVSYRQLLVTQQDIKVFTEMVYIVLMLYNAVFCDQWWRHLAA